METIRHRMKNYLLLHLTRAYHINFISSLVQPLGADAYYLPQSEHLSHHSQIHDMAVRMRSSRLSLTVGSNTAPFDSFDMLTTWHSSEPTFLPVSSSGRVIALTPVESEICFSFPSSDFYIESIYLDMVRIGRCLYNNLGHAE